MPHTILRKTVRKPPHLALFNVLLVEKNAAYARSLKRVIEDRLPATVTIARNVADAEKLLQVDPTQFFIGITSVIDLDSSELEKIDLLGKYHLSVIAIVNQYEDEMRDQLIKRHVIDYIVKGNSIDNTYICDLILRVYKNSKIKVLVADDSVVSRFVIARELALQKFQVIQASNGEQALKALKDQPDIKLVLVDQQMPKIDGCTFVAKARELYTKDQLLIIGISTSIDPRLSVKFLKAGANDFISKPFNYEILLCRINQNLDMLDAVELAKELSNTDFLSGLRNRRYFFEQGSKILKALKQRETLTVMMIDIDFFKKVNDLYGHDVGDGVIKNIASLLKANFPDDIVARVGGEEFAVMSKSPEYKTNPAHIDAFRLTVANQKVKVNKHVLQYTCSVGVCNEVGADLDEMLAKADRHLYMAKRAGRNQVYGKFTIK